MISWGCQKNPPNMKEKLQSLISDEKDRFSRYSQLCAHYCVQPDQLIVAESSTIIATLELVIKTLKY
jgi:hypothetical protein